MPLFVGVLCLSLFCFALLCVLLVCTHLEEGERAGCFAFIVLRMSYYCIDSVDLPRGTVGCSVMCDCCVS